MARKRRYRESGPPATLGTTLKAGLSLIASCRVCLHQATPDLAEQIGRLGADLSVIEWGKRLVCSRCGSHDVDCVVAGYRPPAADWT